MSIRSLLLSLALLLAAGAAPAGAAVVLNEINCEGVDWVEIVNTGSQPAPVGGLLLTDDPLDVVRATHRMILPAGTTIAAGGRLTIEKGGQGFPFGIGCGDDTIRLADPATSTELDAVAVPELTDPLHTWGRYPDGTGAWTETAATRDAPNVPADGGGGPDPGDAAVLYDPEHVTRIDLSLPPESQAALDADPRTYVEGTLAVTTGDGVSFGPYRVAIKLKGHSTFQPLAGKAAFRIKLDRYVAGQRLLGLRNLTLNNMLWDATMLRETLAYELFRAVGVPAPRTGYAYVRVNGADYGLYANIETVDRTMLARWFPSTRHLYEADGAADLAPSQTDGFEVDEGDENDRSDLDALVAAAADPGTDALASVADLDEMTRMWAVERYAGHWDGYAAALEIPHNYFLHSDATSRFSMLPWSLDQAWFWDAPFVSEQGGVLFHRCLDDPSCAARYRAALVLVGERAGALDLDARAALIDGVIAPWRSLDPRQLHYPDEIAAGVADLHRVLRLRPTQLAGWLDPSLLEQEAVPPQAPPDGPPAPAPKRVTTPAMMSVGRHDAGVRGLYTKATVRVRGTLTIRVLARSGGRTTTLCSARATVRTPGVVALRCTYTQASARLRARRALPVTVETVLRRTTGARETRVRPAKLPRLRAR